MNIPESVQQWLFSFNTPYIKYNVQRILNPEQKDETLLLRDRFIRENIKTLGKRDSIISNKQKRADPLMYRLTLLADLGVNADYPGLQDVLSEINEEFNEHGSYKVDVEIPVQISGNGHPQQPWMFCDSPIMLYALLRIGVYSSSLNQAVEKLMNLEYEKGFRCKGSIPKSYRFGSREPFCPYASLIAAKALSEHPLGRTSEAAYRAIESVLNHWEEQEKSPYSTRFKRNFMKLRFPFIWYDLLHILDVITRYPDYTADPRVLKMGKTLLHKGGESLKFHSGGTHQVFAGRDFAAKRKPSPTVTLFALRALKRLNLLSFPEKMG